MSVMPYGGTIEILYDDPKVTSVAERMRALREERDKWKHAAECARADRVTIEEQRDRALAAGAHAVADNNRLKKEVDALADEVHVRIEERNRALRDLAYLNTQATLVESRLNVTEASRDSLWWQLVELRKQRDRLLEKDRLLEVSESIVRDLITTEWSGREDYVGDGGYDCCPVCRGVALCHDWKQDAIRDIGRGQTVLGHRSDCARDQNLADLGYPDQPSRDAARERVCHG